jgi:hypothetical protein
MSERERSRLTTTWKPGASRHGVHSLCGWPNWRNGQLDDGVIEGRKVFSNIIKYVRMGASSNFGNMFSVLGASFFVPFLPMRPVQILANNLLYDIGQTAIPTDNVDAERLQAPRAWDIKQLTRFIAFIGPCSSVFDYSTFFGHALRVRLLRRIDAAGRGAQRERLPDGLVR